LLENAGTERTDNQHLSIINTYQNDDITSRMNGQ